MDAVYEADLKAFLEPFGLVAAFEARELRCSCCDEVVRADNLYGFVAAGADTVLPVCLKPSCVAQAYGSRPRVDNQQGSDALPSNA